MRQTEILDVMIQLNITKFTWLDHLIMLCKEIEEDKKMPVEETLCPECNGKMVSRKGQYGMFWGCAAFPQCKGTRDNQGRSKADRAAERAKRDPDCEAEHDIGSSNITRQENDHFKFNR